MSGNPTRSIRVIFNPAAGQKAGFQTNQTDPETIRDLMRRNGLGDEMVITQTEEESVESARDAVERGYDLVVSAGGDGTTGIIAWQLLDSDTALGILPLGSVMNISRMLGIPREVEAAAEVIAGGVTRRIDVGEANGQLFVEAGSIGMNAAIFREAQRFDAGEYRSILTALWVAFRYRPPRMRVHLDDQTIETRASMVTIANGPYTGLGFTVAPEADLTDGRFDVGLFRRFSRVGLLVHLARIAFGRRHYSPKVLSYRSTHVRIESWSSLPARADSHDLGTTPITFTTRPSSLSVVVPKK